MFKLVLEKAEEPETIANICWIMKKEIRFVFTRCGGLGAELDEDIQKV